MVAVRCVGWQKQRVGPCRRSNPGPLEPKSRIIPLDHRADTKIKSKQNNITPNIKHNATQHSTHTHTYTLQGIHDTRTHTKTYKNNRQTHILPLLVRSQHIHTSSHIYHPSSSPRSMPIPHQTTRQSRNQFGPRPIPSDPGSVSLYPSVILRASGRRFDH